MRSSVITPSVGLFCDFPLDREQSPHPDAPDPDNIPRTRDATTRAAAPTHSRVAVSCQSISYIA